MHAAGLAGFAAAGLVLAALTLARLPDARPPHPRPGFDVAGAVLLAAALLGLLVLIERGDALSLPTTVALADAAAATVAAFTAVERRTTEPVGSPPQWSSWSPRRWPEGSPTSPTPACPPPAGWRWSPPRWRS